MEFSIRSMPTKISSRLRSSSVRSNSLTSCANAAWERKWKALTCRLGSSVARNFKSSCHCALLTGSLGVRAQASAESRNAVNMHHRVGRHGTISLHLEESGTVNIITRDAVPPESNRHQAVRDGRKTDRGRRESRFESMPSAWERYGNSLESRR